MQILKICCRAFVRKFVVMLPGNGCPRIITVHHNLGLGANRPQNTMQMANLSWLQIVVGKETSTSYSQSLGILLRICIQKGSLNTLLPFHSQLLLMGPLPLLTIYAIYFLINCLTKCAKQTHCS